MSDSDVALEGMLPLLKKYLDLADTDREATKYVITELKKASKESRDCSVAIKLQLKVMETQFADFIKNCAGRKSDCAEKFIKIDNKLDKVPSEETVSKIEKKLEKLPSDDYKEIKDKQWEDLVLLVGTIKKEQDNLKVRTLVAIGIGSGVGTIMVMIFQWILNSIPAFG